MTREDILNTYAINDRGFHIGPGKFEHEPIYAPYFYENASDGEELAFMEDGLGEYVSLITINDDDRREFPELGTALYVTVSEDSNGFVWCKLVETEERANEIRAAYEIEDEEGVLTIRLPKDGSSF